MGGLLLNRQIVTLDLVMQQTHLSEAVIIFIINVTASHAGALPLQLQPVSEQIQ